MTAVEGWSANAVNGVGDADYEALKRSRDPDYYDPNEFEFSSYAGERFC